MKRHHNIFTRWRNVALACLLTFAGQVTAELRLPAIFSDHMVVQQNAAVPVWGWADPGEEITLEFAGQKKTAVTDGKGKWMVKLDPLPASAEARVLTVRSRKGNREVRVNDVLIGEVWLGSGQSNMAMSVERAKDFEQEKAAASLPQIRMFTASSPASAQPQDNCGGTWVVCAPETVGKFSATLYFFGREVHRELRLPMGLVNSSVGGTPIDSWIDAGAQRAAPGLKALFENTRQTQRNFDAAAARAQYEKALVKWQESFKQARAENKPAPRKPRDPVALNQRKGDVGGLFNGKIAPLIPYAIRGALWYQGEANANELKAPFYHEHLSLLVSDWRQRWGYEFPFAWVQLPNFTRGNAWVLVREAMLQTLELPKTGMAVTIDVGDPKDIHPKNKQEVGKRLALWALGSVYGKAGAISGPLLVSHEISNAQIVLRFKHTDGGLIARGGGDLKGFVIAEKENDWKPAQARIQGDQIVATHPDLKKPLAVRYAWQDNPDCNLCNGAGLPASPFRTDTWKVSLP